MPQHSCFFWPYCLAVLLPRGVPVPLVLPHVNMRQCPITRSRELSKNEELSVSHGFKTFMSSKKIDNIQYPYRYFFYCIMKRNMKGGRHTLMNKKITGQRQLDRCGIVLGQCSSNQSSTTPIWITLYEPRDVRNQPRGDVKTVQ